MVQVYKNCVLDYLTHMTQKTNKAGVLLGCVFFLLKNARLYDKVN